MHASGVILVSILTSAITAGSTVYLMERLQLVDGVSRPPDTQPAHADSVVPNLLGLSEADARSNLTTTGFVTLVGAAKHSDRVKPHLVAEQVPAAGLPLKKGSSVTINLAAPLPEVPQVLGRTEPEAKAILEKAGFKFEVGTPLPDPSVEKGAIASQLPQGNEEAAPGSKVLVRLSSGPEPVVVPKVLGLNVASAKKMLTDAGLELGAVRWVHDDDLFSGAILRQDPSADARIAPGTTVNITVNRDY